MSLQSEFPTRLLTLSDGRPGLRGALHVDITDPGPAIKNQKSKIENPNPAVLDFISSDETLDRYDEIIVASGWRLHSNPGPTSALPTHRAPTHQKMRPDA
jgi:hypothetical protein